MHEYYSFPYDIIIIIWSNLVEESCRKAFMAVNKTFRQAAMESTKNVTFDGLVQSDTRLPFGYDELRLRPMTFSMNVDSDWTLAKEVPRGFDSFATNIREMKMKIIKDNAFITRSRIIEACENLTTLHIHRDRAPDIGCGITLSHDMGLLICVNANTKLTMRTPANSSVTTAIRIDGVFEFEDVQQRARFELHSDAALSFSLGSTLVLTKHIEFARDIDWKIADPCIGPSPQRTLVISTIDEPSAYDTPRVISKVGADYIRCIIARDIDVLEKHVKSPLLHATDVGISFVTDFDVEVLKRIAPSLKRLHVFDSYLENVLQKIKTLQLQLHPVEIRVWPMVVEEFGSGYNRSKMISDFYRCVADYARVHL